MSRQIWFARKKNSLERVRCHQSYRFSTPNTRRLRLEKLENRILLAVFSVSNLDDSGSGSLQQAVLDANATAGPDEISFSVVGTIGIDSQLPTITDDLTITGPGATLLTIDAGNGADNEFNTGDGYRIFNIDDGNQFNGLNVALRGLTLTGGDVAGEGGAIFSNENLTIENSTISGNASTGNGGGISGYVGSPTIISSTISSNSANFGGGIYHKFGMAKISSSTFSGNNAASDGGAIFSNQFLAVDNSTISGNSASAGGGILNSGTATITSSTFTGNTVIFDGGGIRDLFASTMIDNTIVAGNMAGSGPDVLGSVIGTFNLIGNGTGLSGVVNGVEGNQVGSSGSLIAPLLDTLADNGGPTLTHALLAGSPAIDAGDPNFVVPPNSDQRGAPFIRVAEVRIDVGAYEFQAIPPTPTLLVDILSDVSNGNHEIGDLSLREAIMLANATAGPNEISFSVIGTIGIGSQLPTITDDLTITGPGATLLTIDAGNGTDNEFNTGDGYRIFDIDDGNQFNGLNVALSGLTLTGGDVTDNGGAISSNENLTVKNIAISGNAATGDGGGIINSFSTANISSSTISGNMANFGGGIHNSGTTTITASTISGNTASIAGGGIASFYGTIETASSTLSGNSAIYGGGIYNTRSATITSSTISGNTANFNRGGGVASYGSSVTNTEVLNSIISGNFGGISGTDVSIVNGATNSFTTLGYNLIGIGNVASIFTGTGDQKGVTNPKLGPLADNGGPTLTRALLPGSPAIDAGDPSILFDFNEFDTRSAPFVRVFDDPFTAGTGIDIGAYERQSLADSFFIVTTTADELDYNNAEVSLRETIKSANGSVGFDVITFNSLFTASQTIDIDSQLPTVVNDLTITGPGANLLTLDAGNGADGNFNTGDGYRIFNINDGDNNNEIEVLLRNLSLTGGDGKGNGGAIFSSEALRIENSSISDNAATPIDGEFAADGGGIQADGTTTITSSTISGNVVNGAGGGIRNHGSLTITSSTISGNTARFGGGGGISNNGVTTIKHSTISYNSTSASGGGIRNFGTATLNNTIVANSMNPFGVSSDVDGSVSGTFNLIGVDTALAGIMDGVDGNQIGTEVTPIAPLLDPMLANNGGPTLTHALQPLSPALNLGDPSFDPNDFIPPLINDQRGKGFDRVSGGRIDIGAFERSSVVESADFDGDLDVDGADFLAWQRGFGILAPNGTPADGDADGDGNVNAVDLQIWEAQFGILTSQPLSTLVVDPPQPKAVKFHGKEFLFLTADLIDAALTTKLLGVSENKELPITDEKISDDSLFPKGHEPFETSLTPIAVGQIAVPDAVSDDTEYPDYVWLADELLYRVFS